MSHLTAQLAGRVPEPVKQWFRSRLRECVHCCQCEGDVTPWDTYCPNCGQRNPARIAACAPLYLALGFVLLAMVASGLILLI